MGSILALDLGTRTGWAFWSEGAIVSGTESFKVSRYDSSGMRFVRFRRFLNELHRTKAFMQIVFEEVRRHKGVDAAHAYGGYMATLQAWSEENSVPLEAYAVGEIKKYWTGAGNASKEAMVKRARDLGFHPTDDNEADALAMVHMAIGGSVL